MITLYESLLDNLDDLEKGSDEIVKYNNCIGKYYKVKYLTEEDEFLRNFSLKELKKLKFKYDCGNILLWRGHVSTRPTVSSKAVCNIVLNSDISLLTENDKDKKYIETKNEIIKQLYSCSYLADDKGFLTIEIHKSYMTIADWFVNIYNDQDQSHFTIVLQKKVLQKK